MARLPRVVIPQVAHHVTQRGNARQVVFHSDSDRLTYLELLREYSQLYGLSLLGYCLMSNHIHLIAVPQAANSLGQTLKHAHGRYATYWNARHAASGHVWQGRFYSCPLADVHLWSALRYVELNPVRARMVGAAGQWQWSSAAAHCEGRADAMLEMQRWQRRWTVAEWCEHLAQTADAEELRALRSCTHTGRPLGSADFVAQLEELTARPLAARIAGRPRRSANRGQAGLSFVA